MMTPAQPSSLLAFARRLQSAASYAELIASTREEIQAQLGYASAWLYVVDDESLGTCRLWAMSGAQADAVALEAQELRTDADAMVAEIMREQTVQVIADARTDPRTDKAIVEALGNRTIINIALRLLEHPLGVLGVGTFGDEGVRIPSAEDLDYLERIASHLSVAAGRLRLLEVERARQREQLELAEQLARARRFESLGFMAAGVAHDFNNLITVIALSAGRVARDPLSDRQATSLDALQAACERAKSLVKQLHAVGREGDAVFGPIDLAQRLRDLTRYLRPAMSDSVELVYRGDPEIPIVAGDGGQLDQVITNLCFNARDAMPKGGQVRIAASAIELDVPDVSGHPWMNPGAYVRVTVADEGIGMGPEVAERAFEPFFTTKAVGEGTGLGLAMAYALTRQHGGRLSLESALGEGTVVTLDLPVA